MLHDAQPRAVVLCHDPSRVMAKACRIPRCSQTIEDGLATIASIAPLIASHMPICADESLHTAVDPDVLIGRYDHAAVKLDETAA